MNKLILIGNLTRDPEMRKIDQYVTDAAPRALKTCDQPENTGDIKPCQRDKNIVKKPCRKKDAYCFREMQGSFFF